MKEILAPQSEEKPSIQQVDFTPPEHSLETWMDTLNAQGIRPLKNIHYKEFNSSLYKNTKVDSYEVDVDEAGIDYKDEQMALRLPNAAALTIDEQKTLINTGIANARRENKLAMRNSKTWIVLKREIPNDTRTEDSLLRYVDETRKKPEWDEVIHNLAQHGKTYGYDEVHYKQALDRWLSYFLPSLQKITKSMESKEIAGLLLNMHKPKTQYDMIQKEMMDLVRHPGEELESKLALLKSLANSMYEKFPEPERISNVERILLNGLLQFTTGTVRRNAELTIEFEKRKGNPLKFDKLLLGAIDSERVYGSPTIVLHYNTPLNPATMVYNVRTGPIDYVRHPQNLVNDQLSTGNRIDYSHFPNHYNYDNAKHNVGTLLSPRQAVNNVVQEELDETVRVEEQEVEVEVPHVQHGAQGGAIRRNLANISQLSVHDDSVFHDAVTSTPVLQNVRKSERDKVKTSRYASAMMVDMKIVEDLVGTAVENYYIKSKSESDRKRRSRSIEKKDSKNSKK